MNYELQVAALIHKQTMQNENIEKLNNQHKRTNK